MTNIHTALTVTTFAEFEQYVVAFARGRMPLLLLVGDPGCSKSQTVKRAIRGECCWIEGQASAVGIYEELFKHKNKPIVIDDVDELYAKSTTRRLIKTLCQTDIEKEVSWNTQNRSLEMSGIPKSFITTSRVCIIANEWQTLNSDVRAIEDRAVTVIFKPTPLEIHLHAARWFKDQVVFDFMASILHLVVTPSLRHYIFARSLREGKIKDWRERTIERVCDPELRVVAQLETDAQFDSKKERISAFVEGGHGHRATYFRLAKKLPEPMEVPAIKLRRVAKSQRLRKDILQFRKTK